MSSDEGDRNNFYQRFLRPDYERCIKLKMIAWAISCNAKELTDNVFFVTRIHFIVDWKLKNTSEVSHLLYRYLKLIGGWICI